MKIILLVLLGIYILSGVGLYFLQERFIFLDEQLPADYKFDFETPFEEVFLEVKGANLHGLHFKHKEEDRNGVMLYYHGNAQSLRRWGKVVQYHYALGYDVIVMDYRGYGKSTGKRSQKALLSDALAFYDYAKTHFPESEITVYGRSLGTGFATYVASQNSPKRLILETPYHDFQSLAQRFYPIFPMGMALRFKFKPFEYVKTVNCPIHIFHGTEDNIVPYEQGFRLYQEVPAGQADLITIPGGEHNNLLEYEKFKEELERVLE